MSRCARVCALVLSISCLHVAGSSSATCPKAIARELPNITAWTVVENLATNCTTDKRGVVADTSEPYDYFFSWQCREEGLEGWNSTVTFTKSVATYRAACNSSIDCANPSGLEAWHTGCNMTCQVCTAPSCSNRTMQGFTGKWCVPRAWESARCATTFGPFNLSSPVQLSQRCPPAATSRDICGVCASEQANTTGVSQDCFKAAFTRYVEFGAWGGKVSGACPVATMTKEMMPPTCKQALDILCQSTTTPAPSTSTPTSTTSATAPETSTPILTTTPSATTEQYRLQNCTASLGSAEQLCNEFGSQSPCALASESTLVPGVDNTIHISIAVPGKYFGPGDEVIIRNVNSSLLPSIAAATFHSLHDRTTLKGIPLMVSFTNYDIAVHVC